MQLDDAGGKLNWMRSESAGAQCDAADTVCAINSAYYAVAIYGILDEHVHNGCARTHTVNADKFEQTVKGDDAPSQTVR